MLKHILKLGFAKFTVECFPSIGGHVWRDLFVLVSTQPLSQAIEVHVAHRTGTFTGRNQRILLLIILFTKADPAHDFAILASLSILTSFLIFHVVFHDLIYFVDLEVFAANS